MDNTNNMSNTNIKQHIIIIIYFQENLYEKKNVKFCFYYVYDTYTTIKINLLSYQ